MDVGRFARRKTELWLWILSPLVLIWFLHAGSLLYHLVAESTLAGLEAHAAIIPELTDTHRRLDEYLEGFQVLHRGEREAMDEIARVLDRAESASGFVVNSLRAEEAPAPKKKGVRAVDISVIGAGELVEVMRFLDEVQKPRHLVDVASANLNIMAAAKNPIYSARFTFRCYDIRRTPEHR